VAIDGPEEAVLRAAKEIEALLFDPAYRNEMKAAQLGHMDGESTALVRAGLGADIAWMVTPSAPRAGETTFECRVPNSMVGLVIGKGGESVKRLQADHGVRVQIAKEPEPPENLMVGGASGGGGEQAIMRRVALTGPEMGIESAKREIEEILRSRASFAGGMPAFYGGGQATETITLKIPNDKVGLVIGKAGATIRGIQERTGANIKVPPTPDQDDPDGRTLCITADHVDRANAARVEIEALVREEIMRQQGIATADTDIYPVPEACVGLVIGKGGETIHRIQASSGSRVQIPHLADPNTNPPMRMVAVTGPPSAREAAKFEISQLVSQHEARNGKIGVDPLVGPPPDPYAPNGALLYPPFDPALLVGDPYAAAAQQQHQQQQPPIVVDPWAAAAAAAQAQQQQQQAPMMPPNHQDAQWAAHAGVPQAAPFDQSANEYAPEAYYEDFWNYAGWYGEDAARQAYGAYAPPPGTAPPPHIQLPQPQLQTDVLPPGVAPVQQPFG